MIYEWIAASMLVEAIVFGVLAYVMFRKKRAKLALCQRTWGNVIEVKEREGGEGGTTRHPVIRYRNARGEEATFESKFGSSNWKVKAGDRLEILVNPSKPAESQVVGFMAQWGLPFVFGIVSVVSIIGVPVVYLALKP